MPLLFQSEFAPVTVTVPLEALAEPMKLASPSTSTLPPLEMLSDPVPHVPTFRYRPPTVNLEFAPVTVADPMDVPPRPPPADPHLPFPPLSTRKVAFPPAKALVPPTTRLPALQYEPPPLTVTNELEPVEVPI